MVNPTALILNLIILLLYNVPGLASAKSQLKLVLNNSQVELGESVEATVYGIDLPREILLSDLQVLQTNFGIKVSEGVDIIEDVRWPGQQVQVLPLELYPRSTGTVKVEQLHIGDNFSPIASVDVKQGEVKGKSISIETRASTLNPWERQQVLFEIKISTPQLFASLSSEDIIKLPGYEIVALPISKQRTTTANGEQFAVLRMGWAIFPLIPGKHHITLPEIQYNLSGQVRRSYYLPILQLNTRTLPPYVPPTMPIANIAINSTVNASSPLDTNSLYYWKITLKSAELRPYWLPPVLYQITTNEKISLLQIDSVRSMQPDKNGVHGQVIHHLPFKVKHSGILTLPELRLQIFDPNSGRLTTVIHPSQRFFVISQSWRWLLGSILALFFSWLAKRLVQLWRIKRKRNKKRKFAIEKIEQSQDVPALRTAIKLLGEAEGLPYNLSLSEWAGSYRDKLDSEFERLLTRVSRFCYSDNKETDLATIRSDLLTFIKHKRL